MTYRIFLAIILLLTFSNTFAQINPDEYTMSWYTRDKHNTQPALITATRTAGNSYPYAGPKNGILDSLLQDKTFKQGRPNFIYYTETCDSGEVHFFADHITAANAGEYEFRILVNAHTPLVDWSTVPYQKTNIPAPDRKGNLNWLGGYKTAIGNYLVVDIRKKGTDSIIAYTISYCRPVRPTLLNIYTAAELNEFFKKLSKPHAVTISEHTFLPKKLVLPLGNNSLIFYLRENINKEEQVEYQLLKDGANYLDWKRNDFAQPFIWIKDMPPGQYTLNIRYTIQPQHITSYPFEIKKAWYQTLAFKIAEGILIAAFLGFIGLLLLNYRQKRKLRAEQQKKEKLETEIRALRTQLNPHFIFNALGSIQGLINTGELDSANNYLSDFANLMRDVLNEKNNEYNVLEHEIQTLESYLKLEQLRFHFSYTFTIANTLQPSAIQVPALLLQPLVENAVKHGVSSLQEKGQIDISFEQNNNDMQVRITDNGNGFDTNRILQGYGLELTKRRISFANEISGTQAIFMEIKSGKGTVVTITYQNWLI